MDKLNDKEQEVLKRKIKMQSAILKFLSPICLMGGIIAFGYLFIQDYVKLVSNQINAPKKCRILKTKIFTIRKNDQLAKLKSSCYPDAWVSPSGEEIALIYSLSGLPPSLSKDRGGFHFRIFSIKDNRIKEFSISTPDSRSPIASFCPAIWSPDGSKILLRGETWNNKAYLWQVDAARGKQSFLCETVPDRIAAIFQPWNKSGTKILVAHPNESKDKINLYIRGLDSGKEVKIETFEVGNEHLLYPWQPIKGKIFAMWEPDSDIIYFWQNDRGIFTVNPQNLISKKIYPPIKHELNWVWFDSLYYPKSNLMFVELHSAQDVKEKTLLLKKMRFSVVDLKSQRPIYYLEWALGSDIPLPSITGRSIKISPDGRVILIHPPLGSALSRKSVWILDLRGKARLLKLDLPVAKSEIVLDIRWGVDSHTIHLVTSNDLRKEPVKFFKLYKIGIIY